MEEGNKQNKEVWNAKNKSTGHRQEKELLSFFGIHLLNKSNYCQHGKQRANGFEKKLKLQTEYRKIECRIAKK